MHHIVPDAEALAAAAAEWIANAIRDRVRVGGRCTLALAGGQTPREIYRRLSGLPRVPWQGVEIFFTDERAVPPDSPDSNYGMAREALLSHVPVPATAVHRMEAERDDATDAAREYETLLPAALDLMLLGIGTDGHIASLFPHAPALAEVQRSVVRVVGGEPLLQRLTVTPPVIERAAQILVLAAGTEKAAAVARALEGSVDVSMTPALLARRGTWMLDAAAAARLGSARG